jgi:cytochrome c553
MIRALSVAMLVLAGATLSGCGQPMGALGQYKPNDPSPAFPDGTSSRPLVPGTVARGAADKDLSYYTGVQPDGTFLTKSPMDVTPELLQRGQERFNIYCSMCHGRDGYGHGMIVQRGFTTPPSYHTDQMRSAPLGYIPFVITNGKGAMYSYATRVSPEDRWAIAVYIRTLQLSQHAKMSDVAADQQAQLTTQEYEAGSGKPQPPAPPAEREGPKP